MSFSATAEVLRFRQLPGYVASGYNGGAWNGPGIISTAARVPTNGLRYGLGYADGADGIVSGLTSGQIEVKYTLLGDANLDGVVNALDFSIVAANFNQPVTGWDQGDFNYDGIVNAADFTDLAANFNQSVSGADVSAGDVAALDAFAAANGISLANVPEPASVGLLMFGAVGVLARRYRRDRSLPPQPVGRRSARPRARSISCWRVIAIIQDAETHTVRGRQIRRKGTRIVLPWVVCSIPIPFQWLHNHN